MIFAILTASITTVLAVVLTRQAAGTLSLGKVNLISYVFYLNVLQVFLGAILVSLGYDKHYTMDLLLHPQDTLAEATFFVYLMMIGLPFVMVLVFKILRMNPREKYEEFLSREISSVNNEPLFYLLAVTCIVQLVLLVILITKVGYLPILKLVFVDANMDYALERQRIQALSLFGHGAIKNLIVMFGIPIVSYISFAYALCNRKIKWIAMALVMFGASIITQTFTFAKSPIIFHMFVFFLILTYYKGGLKRRTVFGFIFGMLLILIFMYAATGYSDPWLDIYSGIMGRTFFTQFGTLCFHFDFFGQVHDFLDGASLSPTALKVIGMDPDMHLRSGKIVMQFYGSQFVYQGSAGVMNANFIGEAFANWGPIGILVSIVWVGIELSLLFALSLKIKKTPATLAFIAVLTKTMGSMSQGGFADFVYSASFILTLVGFMVCIYFDDFAYWIRGRRGKEK